MTGCGIRVTRPPDQNVGANGAHTGKSSSYTLAGSKEMSMKQWKVDRDDISGLECSLVQTKIIYIEPVPRQKIEYLMSEYRHQEWMGYMVGEIQGNKVYMQELSIPIHAFASGGMAEAVPFSEPDNCVGVIHSHHSMGAFHSGTDQEYVDKNYPVSVTVACRTGSKLEFDATCYLRTPCGKGTTKKCDVKYVMSEPLFDRGIFLNEAKRNITQGSSGTSLPSACSHVTHWGKGLPPELRPENLEMVRDGRLIRRDDGDRHPSGLKYKVVKGNIVPEGMELDETGLSDNEIKSIIADIHRPDKRGKK